MISKFPSFQVPFVSCDTLFLGTCHTLVSRSYAKAPSFQVSKFPSFFLLGGCGCRTGGGGWGFSRERACACLCKARPRKPPTPSESYDGRAPNSKYWGPSTAKVKMCPHIKPGGGQCGLTAEHCLCICLMCKYPMCARKRCGRRRSDGSI